MQTADNSTYTEFLHSAQHLHVATVLGRALPFLSHEHPLGRLFQLVVLVGNPYINWRLAEAIVTVVCFEHGCRELATKNEEAQREKMRKGRTFSVRGGTLIPYLIET